MKTIEQTIELENVLAIIEFPGDSMSDDQALSLMDRIRELSIADREYILSWAHGPIYYYLSEHNGEMGGLSRY